jgi:hypothetical protein
VFAKCREFSRKWSKVRGAIRPGTDAESLNPRKFPVFSLQTGNPGPETGSLQTGSAAIKSFYPWSSLKDSQPPRRLPLFRVSADALAMAAAEIRKWTQ